MTDALRLLCGLVIDDGRRWGDAAVPVQFEDARAVFDLDGPPFHFNTRARGYAKTDDTAGFSLTVMLAQLPAGSRCYAMAADKDQARLLIDSIRGFVLRTPELEGAVTVDQYKVHCGGSVLEALPADVAGAYGLRPAWLVADELAQWASTECPKKMWEATTSAMAKVAGSRLLVLTSAGDPSHWSHAVLEHAYRDELWRVHEVPGPPPWADQARLAEQKARLPESSYRRLFLNEWTSSEDRLTTMDDLRACVQLAGPQEPAAAVRYVIGLDIGIKHDRTVATVCHRDRAGRVLLDRIGVWEGSRTRPVDLSEVEEWMAFTAHRYNRARCVIDPYQAIGLIQRLRRRGLTVTEFTFSQPSVSRLAVALHIAIREHRVLLPDDEALIDELSNVKLLETSTPGVLRLDHAAGAHDDRAISLALSLHHLLSAPASGVSTESRFTAQQEPVVHRGELVLRGRHYIDRP